MNDAFIVSLLSVVPHGLGSRLQGVFGRSGLSRLLLGWYVRNYGVDLSEIEGTLDDYRTLQDFFVRALKPGTRPVAREPEALVSPVDARVYHAGKLSGFELPPEAGLSWDVRELVGGGERYEGGSYAILYLSPKDYHRVHVPREGTVLGYRYLPGRLWPVFPAAVREVEGLFAKNERLAVRLGTQDMGELAVVLVGAYGVGRMTAAFAPIITNTGTPGEDVTLPEAWSCDRGDELGRFNLGSTVILVCEAGRVTWELERDQDVKMGQRIGRLGG